MSKYAYTVSEIALAEAIASAVLRTPDAIKQEIVEVTLETVKIPEVRSALVKTAKAVGIELADDNSLRDPVTGRTPRGAAIALGWKRRNEGIAAAKQAAAEPPSADASKAAAHQQSAPATASDPKGGIDPASSEPKTQLGPLRAILPPTSRPAPQSAVSGSTPLTEDRRDVRDN